MPSSERRLFHPMASNLPQSLGDSKAKGHCVWISQSSISHSGVAADTGPNRNVDQRQDKAHPAVAKESNKFNPISPHPLDTPPSPMTVASRPSHPGTMSVIQPCWAMQVWIWPPATELQSMQLSFFPSVQRNGPVLGIVGISSPPIGSGETVPLYSTVWRLWLCMLIFL